MNTSSLINPLSSDKRGFYSHGETAVTSSTAQTAIEILSEAGHDLRSPISGIRAAIQEVAEENLGPLNQFQSELLRDILAQCDTLLEMSEHLLSSDRLNRRTPGTLQSWIAPKELVKGLKNGLNASAQLKRVAVQWEGFERCTPRIYGDRIAIERLIYNLAGNAIQVSPEKSSVRIALQASSDSGISEIAISDSGPGISPISLETISQRGFTGQNRTGLGLAICRALAASQSTRIQIKSLQGGGSQISFEVATGHVGSIAKLFMRWRKTLIAGAKVESTEVKAEQMGKKLPIRSATTMARNIPESNSQSNALSLTSIRVDPAKRTSSSNRHPNLDVGSAHGACDAYLPLSDHHPNNPKSAVVTQMHVPLQGAFSGALPQAYPSETADEMDRFVQRQQHYHELAYRYDEVHWFLLWDCCIEEGVKRQQQFVREFQERFDACPIFEKPLLLEFAEFDCDDTAASNRFQELMIRATLTGRLPKVNDRYRGTPPRRSKRGDINTYEAESTMIALGPKRQLRSPSEWNRVNQELRQLRRQLTQQSSRLSTQAERFGQSVASDLS